MPDLARTALLARSALLALAGLLCAAVLTPVALAQDDGDGAAVAAETLDGLLDRLRRLTATAEERPRPPRADQMPADRKEHVELIREYRRARDDWEAAIRGLVSGSDEYAKLAGGGGALEARYHAGFGRARLAEIVTRDEATPLLLRAAEDLRAFVDGAPDDSALLPDGLDQLTRVMLRNAGTQPDPIAVAAEVGGRAVTALQAAANRYDAGALAFVVLRSLIESKQEEKAAELAAAWDVPGADWDVSTENVRKLARRAGVRPGMSLASLPVVEAANGGVIDVAALRGQPLLLHFFSTPVSTKTREVETIVRPLRDMWAPFGLRVVGVSMDYRMDDELRERTIAAYEEWGKEDPVYDGRLESVRAWCEQELMDWPWHWDGKWMKNELTLALGLDANRPFAIVVDESGVIRFRGAGLALVGPGIADAVFEMQKSFAKTGDGRALMEAAAAAGVPFPASAGLDGLGLGGDGGPGDGLDVEIRAGVEGATTELEDPDEWEDPEDWEDYGDDEGDSGDRGLLGLVIGVGVALLVGLLFLFRRR